MKNDTSNPATTAPPINKPVAPAASGAPALLETRTVQVWPTFVAMTFAPKAEARLFTDHIEITWLKKNKTVVLPFSELSHVHIQSNLLYFRTSERRFALNFDIDNKGWYAYEDNVRQWAATIQGKQAVSTSDPAAVTQHFQDSANLTDAKTRTRHKLMAIIFVVGMLIYVISKIRGLFD